MNKDFRDVPTLKSAIIAGNRLALAKGITLLESTKQDDRALAEALLSAIHPEAGNSIRIGISGVPGVGKSTFIEAFGLHLLKSNKKVAVLAVDPSSSTAKGSILGDKTRMQKLAAEQHAFIRPSPSSGNLGGVGRKTRETIMLCEAAGFDVIIIETVGVGQSEITVRGMVDFFLLLMIAGAGDELQGIKRGIMEIADLVVVNKADGDNIPRAKAARQDYARALHMFQAKKSGWTPFALICSSIENSGIDAIWESIENFEKQVKANGSFLENRKQQDLQWFIELFDQILKEIIFEIPAIQLQYDFLLNRIHQGKIAPSAALTEIKNLLLKEIRKSNAQ